MKTKTFKSRKIYILLAVLCFVTCILGAMSLSAGAAELPGKSFSAAELYEMKSNITPGGSITFEAEIYLPEARRSGRAGSMISNYNGGTYKDSWAFEIRNSHLFAFADNGTLYKEMSYDISTHMGTDADPKYVKIAVTADTATGDISLYVNGEYKEKINYSGIASDVFNTSQTLVIGGDRRSSNTSYFLGNMKNVAVYKGVRGADVIAKDHAATFYDTTDSNLLFAYDLTAAKDGFMKDLSANKNDANNKNWKTTEGTTFSSTTNIPYVTKDYTEAPMTYEAVVYAPMGVSDTGAIIANYPDANGDSFLFQVRGNGQPSIFITDQGKNRINYRFNYDIRRNAFVHLAITQETVGSDTVFKCYVDGELVDSYTLKNYVFKMDMEAFAATRRVSLGQCGRANLYWKGSIKNIAVHNKTLTAEEIKASYESGVNAANDDVIACYDLTAPLKDGMILDKSDNGHHASYYNWTSSEGRKFTETEEPVYLTKDIVDAPYTYEAVIHAPMNVDRPGAIIGNYPNSNGDSFMFEIKSGGKPAIYIYENGEVKVNYSFNYDVRRSTFVHVAITHETVDGNTVFKCYVDGELVDTYTKSNYVFTMDMQKMKLTGPASLGSCVRKSLYWHGSMKSVALHNRALSAEEIKASYINGVNDESNSLILHYDTTGDQATADVVIDRSGNGYDMAHLFYEKDFTTEDYDYSFAVVGDTQFMVYNDAVYGTDYTKYIYDWIVDNYDAKKMQYVFGLGDIIDNGKFADGTGSASAEWAYAKELIVSTLGANNIPYSVIGGNHDFMRPWDTGFNSTFGNEPTFTKNITGYYQGTEVYNYYINFEVGETPYMLLALEYGANDDVLAWANDIVAANSHRRVIVTTHGYMYSDGTTLDGGDYAAPKPNGTDNANYLKYNNGDEIWEKFVRKHANIALVLSGHIDYNNVVMREDIGDHGNTVHQFLIDPQKMDRAYGFETGMVAMLYFRNGGKDVSVEYVSTYRTVKNNDKEVLFNRANQFDFTIKEAPKAESKGKINVWLIGGQSNAAGYGKNLNDNDIRFTTGFDNVLYYGYSEKWNTSFSPVTIGLGNSSATSGAEIGIAKALGDTGEMNVIIKYAEGASCICPSTTDVDAQKRGTWTSPSYIEANSINTDGTKVGLLYDNFINTVQSAVAELERMGYTPVVKGMWWMQGEAETYIDEGYANQYAALLSSLIADVRSDVGNMVGADLSAMPFVLGQIYRNPSSSTLPYMSIVQEQQRIVAATVENTAIVYPTDYENFVQHDGWHYDANTQCYLGRTFVEKANLINGEYIVEIAGTNVSAIGGGLYKNGETVTVTFVPKADYDLQSLTLKVGSGEAVSIIDKLDGMSYTFVCEGEQVTFSAVAKSAYDVETAYGTIPKEYASETDYPVALFDTSKNYLGGYQNVTDALKKAIQNTSGNYVILLRNDVSQTTGTFVSSLTGSITIDLGGNTLTKAGTAYVLECYYGGAAHNGGKVTVKNGTLVNKEWSALFCYNYGASLSGNVTFGFEFDNVEFVSEYTAGKGKSVIFETWDNGGNTESAIYADVVFNDCIFNYTGAAVDEVMLGLTAGATRAIFNVTVNGGKIISDVTVNMSNFAKKDGSDTVKLGKGTNGYTVFVPTGDATASTEQFDSVNGGKLSYSDKVYTDVGYVYTLGEDVITEYGTIPYKYTDSNTYPFIVFRNGAFVHAATYFGRDNDPSALSNGKVNGTVILMRRDFTYKESQYNNLSQAHTITIDLGGYTFTSTDRVVFSAQKKTTNNTNITVKNGTFVLGSQPLMKLSSWDPATGGWTAYPGGNGYNFTFESVNVTLTNGATTKNVLTYNAFKAGDPDQFCHMTFNNCTFDLLGSANDMLTLVDFTDALCTASATINGGVIKTRGLIFANLTGGNVNSTFTLSKSNSGYTVLSVPADKTFGELNNTFVTADGVECVFVKVSENNGYVNYSLYPAIMAGYKIKTSVTLWSNFVYNIYIPVANVNGFTVNGKTMEYATETIDGVEYYVVKVDLPAGETLRDIALTVTLNSGNTTVDANWTLNVYNYTKAVLGGNYDDTTKTLMKDMLVYAAAAHTYFENTEAVTEKLSEIKTLLGDYEAEMPTGEAKAPADKTYFTDVAVYLGEVPSFRFYLASGYTAADFSFKVGNRMVEAKASEDGKYVEIVMYAYMMLDDVTFTVKTTGATGTYNLYSYYEYAKTLNNANLTAVVEALMKYSVSANAYRNSVINK